MEYNVDLHDVIKWAGQAAIRGTDANNIVQAGLRSLLHTEGEFRITNPYSSASNGRIPDLTRVLLCDVPDKSQTRHLCVKLYPYSPAGLAALDAHARLLEQLKNVISVPEVVHVALEPDMFGFPALVTTAFGQPLGLAIQRTPNRLQEKVIVRLAEAVAALHACSPSDLSIDPAYDPSYLRKLWQEDAVWYEEHAKEAMGYARLVRTGAAVLARCDEVPEYGSVLHRDLTPYNILTENSDFTAIIDWDDAGFSAPQEDVGKTLIGLLSMLAIPRGCRISLSRIFLDTYGSLNSLSSEELFAQSLPFALDTLLDWIVGGKNALRAELAWATEQILNEGIWL